MKIYKQNDKLIVELDMEQDAIDAIGEKVGTTDNLICVQAGDEQGIHQSIDMTYAGKAPQIDGAIINTNFEEKEFEKKCIELGITYYRYPLCAYCHKVIYGAATIGDKGEQCFGCHYKEENV